jgi:hypothetical protein
MEYDENIIRNRTDISEGSKNTYCYAMKRLLNLDSTKDLKWFLTHPNQTHKLLKAQYTAEDQTRTLVSTLAGFVAYMKYIDVPKKHPKVFSSWQKVYFPYLHQLNASDGANQANEKQMKAFVPWEHVIAKREELGKKELGNFEHLLLCMYTLIPPRRQQDYFKVHLLKDKHTVSDDEKDKYPAYVDFTSKPPMLVVNMYKTAKTKKSWKKELPENLLKVLKASIKLTPRDFLFTQADNMPFKDNNAFQKSSNRQLKKIFDNPLVTINSLRHSYRTFKNGKASLNEMKADAYDMGHSLETHLKYTFLDKK